MRLFRLAKNFSACVGFLWLLVTCTPLDSWWARRLATPWGSPAGDVLVVLGGDNRGTTNIIGESSYLRAVYTVSALRQQSYRRVIITADSGTAQLMREFVVAQGLPAALIEVETKAGSTRENALYVKQMLRDEKGKIILLTSDYHVWRSFRVFQKIGLDVTPSPVPDALKRSGSWQRRSQVFTELCLESIKTVWYRWQGWI